MKTLSIALAVILTAGFTAAQGTDTCTTPTVVVGAGPFAFDNTMATLGPQGQSEALCVQYGTMFVQKDVWFTWQSTFTGFAVATTCGLTTVDTKIGVYPGNTCPTNGTALGCNDDGCTVGLESQTNAFPVTLGQNYVIQVGVYPVGATPGGIGQFDILNVVVPTNNDCTTPTAIAAPGQYMFDTSYASRDVNVGQNEFACVPTGVTPIYRDLWYTYTATTNSVQVKTCDLVDPLSPFTDTRIAVYPGNTCPAQQTAFGCDDDGAACVVQVLTSDLTFPATCGATYMIQLGDYNPQARILGLVEFAEVGAPCNTPATTYCAGDGSDTVCPCSNPGSGPTRGCNNTVGSGGAGLTTAGVASISADTLVLSGNNAVPNGPGLYYQGSATANPSAPFGVGFGNGLRCAGGATPRLEIRLADGAGASSTTVPIHVLGSDAAGDLRYYQLWYRDSPNFGACTGGFNLSAAVSLTWAP